MRLRMTEEFDWPAAVGEEEDLNELIEGNLLVQIWPMILEKILVSSLTLRLISQSPSVSVLSAEPFDPTWHAHH
jgi:hypothetical protein